MSELEALKYLDWTLYFAILILVITVFARIAEAHAAYKQSPLAVECKSDKPDLMEQALTNIAMRKMQIQLRELLVYGEPDDLKDLMAEYMRLKDAQDKKDPDVEQK
jgi:hypothetical protein